MYARDALKHTTMSDYELLNDYDSEPVFYCSVCLSLNIKHEEAIDSDCCGECGSTAIDVASFEEWEKKYEKRYGHKLAEKNEDIRNSPVFKLSFSKLMKKVADCPKWESIIKEVYGCIPKGLGKADSIVMFFDWLTKNNKLDRLREVLYKWKI